MTVAKPYNVTRFAAALGLTVLALVTFGFVMLTSTSAFDAYRVDPYFFAKRQAMWLSLGLVACGITACVKYQWYRSGAWGLFGIAVALLVLVLFVGKPINGARRWLDFGPVQFQPSEFAKYALMALLACLLEWMRRTPKGGLRPRIDDWRWSVLVPLLLTGCMGVLIVREPDLGTTLLLGMCALVLIYVGDAPARWVYGIVAVGAAAIGAFLVAIFKLGMFHQFYQVQRILHWWYEDDLAGINYQQWVAKLALGSGGTVGLGLGNSRQKMAYLPEAHTDFIFPIIGEELGLVATLAVVSAFLVVAMCGIRLATRAPDRFGVLLGLGIVSLISLQAIINLAVVTDSIPNKGIPLPFISYGGSNLVMSLAALGVLFNIARQAQAQASVALNRPTQDSESDE